MAITMDMPAIGQTNKNVFWSILLVGLLALTGLVALASRGAIAMAATIPVPFTVQTGTLTGTNFQMFPGVSSADNTSPVAVTRLDAQIINMIVTKSFSFAGHTVTVTLKAGTDPQHPVTASGLMMDANSLNVDSATFQNMSLNAGGTGGLAIDAPNATLTNATINSPYLLANSITLTGLSVNISIS